jgi:hypothetical protein
MIEPGGAPGFFASNDADRFLSGVRAIGYNSTEFVLSERTENGNLAIFVFRGSIKRRYLPTGWVEEALREVGAGMFGKRRG